MPKPGAEFVAADVYFPDAERIRLVMDNLNTHTIAALYNTFEPAEARRIARKAEVQQADAADAAQFCRPGASFTANALSLLQHKFVLTSSSKMLDTALRKEYDTYRSHSD